MSLAPAVAGSWSALLSQPLVADSRDHLVQFYENDHFLCETVALFAGSGLKHGDGVIIIATASHREAFERRLEAEGFDVEKAKARGQLTMLDAAETLSKFLVDDVPGVEEFINVVGRLIEKTGERYPTIRAY